MYVLLYLFKKLINAMLHNHLQISNLLFLERRTNTPVLDTHTQETNVKQAKFPVCMFVPCRFFHILFLITNEAHIDSARQHNI